MYRVPLLALLGYSNTVSVRDGIAPVGSSGKWKCLRCVREFATKSSAERHFRDAHLTVGMQTCQICWKELNNLTCLQRHCRQMHGISLSDLAKSEMPSARNWDLDHIALNLELFLTCFLGWLNSLDVEDHFAPSNDKWKCLICVKEFATQNTCKRHVRDAHFTFEKQVCDLCGKGLNNMTGLQRHIRNIHEITHVQYINMRKGIMPASST